MNDDQEIDDDILQLLSSSSSSSRPSSRKRKERKKVTFSNIIATTSNEGNNAIQADEHNVAAGKMSSRPLQNDHIDDNVLSFSKSRRNNGRKSEYDSTGMEGIDDLFQFESNTSIPYQTKISNLNDSTSQSENNILRSRKTNQDERSTGDTLGNIIPKNSGKSKSSIKRTIIPSPSRDKTNKSVEGVLSNVSNTRANENNTESSLEVTMKTSGQPSSFLDSDFSTKHQTQLHTNHIANNNSSKVSDPLLSSLSKQLEEQIHTLAQLESKIDASQNDREATFVKKNEVFYTKLEERVEELKDQQEMERHKIQDTAEKINDMIAMMKDNFRDEADKLAKKQQELTYMQTSLIEERSQIQARYDAERQNLKDERKIIDEERRLSLEELEKEKKEIGNLKNIVNERETQLLLEREEHERMKLKEQHRIDLQKAQMKVQQENIDMKMKEMQDREDELNKRSEQQESMSIRIDNERLKLQSMAENLAQLSHQMKIKSKSTDERLAQIERLNNSIEQNKAMMVDERCTLQNDRALVMTSVQEINVMKMDVVRQRVQYLKEKFK